jgi:plasmid stabilization system protein ParE
MISFRFLQEAEAEVDKIAAWYDQQREGLAQDFLRDLGITLQRARHVPNAGTLIALPRSKLVVRRFFFTRFPYKLIAAVLVDSLVVLAVAREERHPYYWRPRLAKVRP